HDQTEALTFADKVVVMNEGSVVQIGTPQELFEKPAHTFVGYFIGSPGMNVFEADVLGNIADMQGYKMQLSSTYKKLSGKIELGVRPEFITLCEEGQGIKIDIVRVEDVAHHKIVRAIYNEKNINIIVPEDTTITPSMNHMCFNMDKVNVYLNDWLVEGEKTS
ncbi:MAG: ABC transporter ATP-binding protein, partial [Campylobacteraceae bacterium]|nr:ABC transporter ATP-binding protein [Campylobacteraceae bacterium]